MLWRSSDIRALGVFLLVVWCVFNPRWSLRICEVYPYSAWACVEQYIEAERRYPRNSELTSLHIVVSPRLLPVAAVVFPTMGLAASYAGKAIGHASNDSLTDGEGWSPSTGRHSVL